MFMDYGMFVQSVSPIQHDCVSIRVAGPLVESCSMPWLVA